ncbi:MAG TPA: c-type cytochrome biogenesis protein CcmI [Azospirillaceae bacterium]|nr:c-type cytochrome biogenesis protein CcmI [Azospirillaceae bacterium]
MTLFWILAAFLTFAVVVVMLRPLVQPRAQDAGSRADYDLEVYRDQLKELDREQQRGLITPTQAEAARAEIGRRMLASAEEAKKAKPRANAALPKGAKALALFLAVLVPVGALMVYVPLGRPNLPAQPLAVRAQGADQPPREVTDAVGKLVAHLKVNPQDLQGWLLLGQVHGRMERWDDSLAAYTRAKALAPDDPNVLASYAEAITSTNHGIINDAAVKGFEAALAKDPKNARSRFYLGLARLQANDLQGALDRFVALAADSPSDAPWLTTVRNQITEVAQRMGRDPAAVMPKPLPPSHPTAAAPALPDGAAAAAQNMSPEEQQAMVRGMVEKLAAKLKDNPADPDGWLRLARSYDVLGEKDKADEAVRAAVAQAPKRVDVLLAYADRLLADVPADKPGPLPPQFIQVIKDVQAISPDNPDVLWFLGLEAANTGKPQEAREMWGRLLATFDPQSEDYAALKARIDGLN